MNNNKLERLCFNLSIQYLSKYNTSSGNLQKHLIKKIKKIYQDNIEEDQNFIIDAEKVIQNSINKIMNMGYLNDDNYAQNKAHQLIKQGKSSNQITQTLYSKGIDKNTINNMFQNIELNDVNLFSAVKYIKKKKFGCFAQDKITFTNEDFYEIEDSYKNNQNKILEKQTATMYRNGFKYDIIKKVLSLDIEEAKDILYSTNIDFKQDN